ncbi:MAG: lamin tail domain-containing protein [Chloroflexi bacterium]|nr:lamin tail domain-containing protein [Chloroflexota bacterium]
MNKKVELRNLNVIVLGIVILTALMLSVVTASADSVEVKINEFVADTGTVQQTEWIELYNPGSQDIDLSGWTIEDGTNKPSSLEGRTIVAGDYLLLLKGSGFSFSLNNSGDTIILNNGGVVIDSVAYGSWDDGNTADNAPKPGKDKSAGRYPDGSDTNADSGDFTVLGAPSPGAQNSLDGGSSGGAIGVGDGEDVDEGSSGAIPAINGWGMGLAVLVFIVAGVVLMRRRQSSLKA